MLATGLVLTEKVSPAGTPQHPHLTKAERRETMWHVLEEEYIHHLEYLDQLTDDGIEQIKKLVHQRRNGNTN